MASRVPYLLHYIGPAAYDIISNKVEPGDPYTKTYAELKQLLADVYAPTSLEIIENFRFHQRKQVEGKTIQQFVAALHKLSINCNFGDYLQTALRNQFVFGLLKRINRDSWRQRMLLSRKQSRLLPAWNCQKRTPINYIQDWRIRSTPRGHRNKEE